ncbi:MAG: hypothetical protein Q8M08_14600 [Bacteroidales bacterium]|nr:hypothetical protein [Bacteroidales bacterium]
MTKGNIQRHHQNRALRVLQALLCLLMPCLSSGQFVRLNLDIPAEIGLREISPMEVTLIPDLLTGKKILTGTAEFVITATENLQVQVQVITCDSSVVERDHSSYFAVNLRYRNDGMQNPAPVLISHSGQNTKRNFTSPVDEPYQNGPAVKVHQRGPAPEIHQNGTTTIFTQSAHHPVSPDGVNQRPMPSSPGTELDQSVPESVQYNSVNQANFPLSNSGRIIENMTDRPAILKAHVFITVRSNVTPYTAAAYNGSIHIHIEYN